MIKNITRLEHKVGERLYHFVCDNDAPLGEIHDALSKFKGYVLDVINSAEKNNAKNEEAKSE